MATISTAIRLNDMMTAPLRNITSAMNMMLSSWEDLESATAGGLNTSNVEGIRNELNRASAAMNQMEEEARHFNEQVDDGSGLIDRLTRRIMGTVGAFAGIQGIKKLVGMSDEFTQTNARLNMINDGMQYTDELINKIMASANRARASFTQTADTVAKLSLNAGDAFNSNNETIQFAENLNKLFAIAGTEQAAISSASLQLTQALGSGVLRGEEFNAVFEAAPNIMQTVADYMGVPIGALRGMAAEGKITADVVKNALLGSTDTINEQFEAMPMTWGQVMTQIMNNLYYATIPLLEVINFLAQNWSIIVPIVLGAAAAIAAYIAATHGAALATRAWTAAQAAFHAVMVMNPVGLVVIAIILIISLIYAVVAAINKVTGQTISATGVITGAIHALFSFMWNIVAAFVNFFANVWNDPIGSIVRLFADLGDAVLGVLELIAKGIDTVFGSDIQSSVAGWRSGLKGMVDENFDEAAVEIMPKMDTLDAFTDGYKFGEGLSDKVGSMFGMNLGEGYGMGSLGELTSNVGNIADSTGSISDSLDVTSEDLKYLRDLAEQETVNRFTTAEIRVEMGGVTNQVSQNTDLDGVVDYMVTGVQEAMERVAEGVHD